MLTQQVTTIYITYTKHNGVNHTNSKQNKITMRL